MLKSHNHPLGGQNKERSVKPNHGRNPNPKLGDQEQAAGGPAMGKKKRRGVHKDRNPEKTWTNWKDRGVQETKNLEIENDLGGSVKERWDGWKEEEEWTDGQVKSLMWDHVEKEKEWSERRREK